jgi:hypothetical protein
MKVEKEKVVSNWVQRVGEWSNGGVLSFFFGRFPD